MENKWIDPRETAPKHGQNCFFITTLDNEVRIGFFMTSEKSEDEGYVGCFRSGTVFEEFNLTKYDDVHCAAGIGFNVWIQNKQEVSFWAPIVKPLPPEL